MKESTLAQQLAEARKLTNEPLHAVPRHPWGMAKRLLAAACAFGIVLGGTAVYRAHNGTVQTGSAAVATPSITHSALQPMPPTPASASAEGQQDRVRHRRWRGRSGKGFYPACLFKVTGEDIKTVSATIDKGAVYRTKTVKRIHRRPRRVGALDASGQAEPNPTVDTVIKWSGAVTRCRCRPPTCAEAGQRLHRRGYDPDTEDGSVAQPAETTDDDLQGFAAQGRGRLLKAQS